MTPLVVAVPWDHNVIASRPEFVSMIFGINLICGPQRSRYLCNRTMLTAVR